MATASIGQYVICNLNVVTEIIQGSKVDMVSGVIQMLICKTHKS